MPELGACGITPATQQLGAVLGEDDDLRLFKDYAAPMVTEGTYSHQVVMEVGHNIPGGYKQGKVYVDGGSESV